MDDSVLVDPFPRLLNGGALRQVARPVGWSDLHGLAFGRAKSRPFFGCSVARWLLRGSMVLYANSRKSLRQGQLAVGRCPNRNLQHPECHTLADTMARTKQLERYTHTDGSC